MNAEKKSNNKNNGQKGKNAQKIIPKEAWKEFYEYWDATEWKDLKVADIKKHLGNGKYVFEPIPKNVTEKTAGTAWINQMKQFKEKGKGNFGGLKVCFKGDKTPLEKVFGFDQISPAEMNKKLWEHIKNSNLSEKK